jgi:hypothetical protein
MDSCESRERVSMSGHVLQSVQQAPRNRHCGLTDDEANSILNYNDNLFLCSSTGTSATPAEVAGCTGGDVDELYETDPIDLSDEVLYTKTPPYEEEAESCMHVFFDEQGCIFQARPPPPHEDISETESAASATDRFASHQPAHKVRLSPCLDPQTRRTVMTDISIPLHNTFADGRETSLARQQLQARGFCHSCIVQGVQPWEPHAAHVRQRAGGVDSADRLKVGSNAKPCCGLLHLSGHSPQNFRPHTTPDATSILSG